MKFLPSLGAALCVIFCVNCRTVPVTERSQFLLTSTSYENQLGSESYDEYKAQYQVSANQEYTQALQRCGNAIKNVAGQTDFQWEFNVFESTEENAFCLPGGKVAVFSGIMDKMNNEAELAFVVAHEIGHAIARHGGERLTRSYLQSLGATAISSAFDNNKTAETIYGIGSQIGFMLPYSRKDENEADKIGLILMAKAGYDPQASVQFWERFSTGTVDSKIAALLSTHPCDSDRIKAMKEGQEEARDFYESAANQRGFGTTFTHQKTSSAMSQNRTGGQQTNRTGTQQTNRTGGQQPPDRQNRPSASNRQNFGR